MSEQDVLRMSRREIKRLKIIHDVLDGRIKQVEAAVLLNLSDRQIRRIVAVVESEGEKGVIHKSRGRSSNRKIKESIKQKVLRLYQKKYEGFGAVLFSEKLEMDGIDISDETLRKWLLEAGLWQRQRRRRSHRQWRRRRECFGEMIQMDGSHRWLEDRGPELVLMGYIDDATGNVFARFYDYEGTLPAMDSFKRYVSHYGLPMSVYVDRHTTYKSTKKFCEELEEERPLSQFERALKELGVEVIHAYSPQAKGRIERLFGVLQDRLVKEMRLEGIKTKDEANVFLEKYWPRFNKRFRVCAANSTDVHVRLNGCNLDRYLCIKTERTLAKDNTISHNGKLYQIQAHTKSKTVIVEERCDGSVHIVSNSHTLKFLEITDRPSKSSFILGQHSTCV